MVSARIADRIRGMTPGVYALACLIFSACPFVAGFMIPLFPCDAGCANVYKERLRYSREPQVTPEWAAAIRAWAEIDGCRRCNNTGVVSIFKIWRERGRP